MMKSDVINRINDIMVDTHQAKLVITENTINVEVLRKDNFFKKLIDKLYRLWYDRRKKERK